MNLARSLLVAARRNPQRCAITGSGETWSFAAFADRVARTATALRQIPGVVDGDRVALVMKNCPEFFQVLYGAWHAGLVAVPVNAKLHPREIAYILGNSGTRICVVTPDIGDALDAGGVTVSSLRETGLTSLVRTDSRAFHSWSEAPAGACVDVAPHALAWLFYTSGTTGQPKGAMLSHRNLAFMCHAYYADFDFVDEQDTMLHAAPLSHGSGLYALPLLAKGAHQVITESGRFDPSEVFDTLDRYTNVSFFAAPTMVTRLISDPGAVAANTGNLRTIVYGGGPMYVSDLQKGIALFGPKFAQLYGQGEAPMTITALPKSVHAQTSHPLYLSRLASCGFPRFGVEVAVADSQGLPLPEGEVGEVITRSDCVMLGYWNNPEATAKAIRGGWLFTGDMGTIDKWGYLTLKDRSKDMIISGGSNIYPREVEEVLLRHPSVAEVAVIGVPDPDWGEAVIAYVVGRPDSRPSESELDTLCLSNIARFKRPKRYVFVDGLPKNNYGKVLKTELRSMFAKGRRESVSSEAAGD